MKYDFRSITPRKGSGSYKWDAEPPFGITPSQMEGVIPMWVADMDFRVAPFIIDALHNRVEHGIFGYTSVPESFYNATIDWFSKYHSWTIKREWMMYTSGVVPAISAVIKGLTSPGDAVIVQTPVYNCFFSSIRNNGCRILESPLKYTPLEEGLFTYRIDWEDLEEKCSLPEAKILLLCNPHNPAGRVWTKDELSRIGKIAREHNIIVVSDEIHCELVMEGYAYSPFASVSEENGANCITLCSPSKSFNTAGLQIANIISPKEEWREKIDKAININEVCDVNPFGVIALEAAYSPEGKEWIDELCQVIGKNYSILCQEIREALPELPVCLLEGTYLTWIDCHTLAEKGCSSEKIEEELLKEERVWINAGKMYGDDSFIRINLACPESLCKEGIKRIVKGLGRLMKV